MLNITISIKISNHNFSARRVGKVKTTDGLYLGRGTEAYKLFLLCMNNYFDHKHTYFFLLPTLSIWKNESDLQQMPTVSVSDGS